jgi:hypothetical protein
MNRRGNPKMVRGVIPPHMKDFVAQQFAKARRQPCPHCGGSLRISARWDPENPKRRLRDIVKG